MCVCDVTGGQFVSVGASSEASCCFHDCTKDSDDTASVHHGDTAGARCNDTTPRIKQRSLHTCRVSPRQTSCTPCSRQPKHSGRLDASSGCARPSVRRLAVSNPPAPLPSLLHCASYLLSSAPCLLPLLRSSLLPVTLSSNPNGCRLCQSLFAQRTQHSAVTDLVSHTLAATSSTLFIPCSPPCARPPQPL